MKILRGLGFILLAASLAGAQNYLTVTGSNTRGYGSALLPAGGLVFTATDSHGSPISYQAGGGGQAVRYPITCPIVNGVVSAGCQVANVSVSNPANFCYAVQIVDSGNKIVLGGPQSGYQCVQPQTSNSWCQAGSCDFDQLVPNIPTALTMLLPTPTPLSIGGVYAATCTAGLVSNGTLTTGLPSCVPGGGGGSSPGGIQGQLQYYAAGGVLGGISGWSTDGANALIGSTNTLTLNNTGISFQALGGASGTGGFFLGSSGAEIFAFGTGNSLILGSTSPAYNFNLSNEHLLAGIVNPSANTTYVYGSPLQVGVNGSSGGVAAISNGLNITSTGTSMVGPFNIPSGTTVTVQSGGALVCASGSSCPSITVTGSLANNVPVLGAGSGSIKADTANVIALTGFDISASNQVTGLRGAVLPALTGTGYLNYTAGTWQFTNPFASPTLSSPAFTGTITTPLIGCVQGTNPTGVLTGTGSPCGGGSISAVNGTAFQVSANTVGSVVTVSLPSVMDFPGVANFPSAASPTLEMPADPFCAYVGDGVESQLCVLQIGAGGQLVINLGPTYGLNTNQAVMTTRLGLPTAAGQIYGWNGFNSDFELIPNVTALSTGFTAPLFTSTVTTGTAPLSVVSTTTVANLTASPPVYSAAGTQATNAHAVEDTCTLGTSCAVTLSGAAAYSGPATYSCQCADTTAANACRANQTSGSAVTFTGTGSDVLRFVCVGN